MRPATPFVVSAPSGTGKTTVCRRVVESDGEIRFSVSHTTRPPRGGERDGVDYHFVGADRFRALARDGAFLEHAEYSGKMYGTSWEAIAAPLRDGCDVLLEIETEGARQVRDRRDDAHLIFLLPPSLEALEARLRGRGTDDDEEIDQRLAIARREFRAAAFFDSFVLNDEVESAVDAVRLVVGAVRRGDYPSIAAQYSREAAAGRLDAALASWIAP